MLTSRKPFYLKKKLLYQTKINLWGLNEKELSSRLKKKKWNFLRFANRRKKKLPTFKFSPFSRNFNRRFNRFNFKNNLYLKKIIRFKYGRLKNKDLYSLFRKSKDYKSFIFLVGSRLDVFLYRIFNKNKKTIFSIRQLLSHKGVLVNGRKVNSPGYSLRKFDIISLKLNDFSDYYFAHNTVYELGFYILYVSRYVAKYASVEGLTEEDRLKLIEEYTKLICPRFFDPALVFIKGLTELHLQEVLHLQRRNSKSSNNTTFVNKDLSKKLSLKKFIKVMREEYLKNQSFLEQNVLKEFLVLEDILHLGGSKDDKDLGFFNINLANTDSFEFKFYKGYLDIIFLGDSEEDVKINSNDKYLLHYLYQ